MTNYTDVLSSVSITPAESSFQSYTLTENTLFNWPYNYAGDGKIMAKVMEITPSSGVIMTVPRADQVSVGEAVIIRNKGAYSLPVQKYGGSSLITVSPGSSVHIYITDNSTPYGTWGIVNYGVGTCAADATSLAGYGIAADGSSLNIAHPVSEQSSPWSVTSTDRAKTFVYTGGTGTVSLPDVSVVGNNFFFLLRNNGSGTLTIDPYSTQTVDGGATAALNPGESTFVISSGTEWYTVGQGRSMTYQFTQLVKDVSDIPANPGYPTITLTDSESSNKLITFTGNPGQAITVIVPSVVAIYYINSNISTSQTITIKTSGGTGGSLDQSQRNIMFCDGVNVYTAYTANVSGSISLEDGSSLAPSLKFLSDTNSGVYNVSPGIGVTVDGNVLAKFTYDGVSQYYTELLGGFVKIPNSATPSQIMEGAMTWDSNDDLLTVGTGAARKTMVDTNSTQTLTNKTLTNPVISGGTLTFASGTGVTTEGVPQWDTTDNLFTIGDGTSFKTMVDTSSTQTLAGKTLTDPTINAGSGVLILPGATTPAQTAEGSMVWDTDSDLLTVGDGASRKTMVDTSSTQTLAGKTLTDPTINAGSGVLVIPGTITPAQTAEGSMVWDTNDDLLTVGDGTSRKTMVDTTSAQAVTGKTLFTYAEEYNAGTITAVGTKNIVWSNGQKQKLTLDGTAAFATTLTFDFAGAGAGHYQLRIIVADSFAYTLTWSTGTPGSAYWLGSSTAPALYTGAASRSTVFNFFWDGTSFICGSGNKVGAF